MHLTALLLAVVLAADTSNPTNSFFRKGEAASVTFSVSKIPAGETLTLESSIYDEHDKKLVNLPALSVKGDAKGKWTGALPLPTDRYGFYRLRAKCGGATLPKLGSRPPGCITYAVVFDPDKRKKYSDDWTFYGLMGGAPGADMWLGTSFHFASATPFSEEYVKAQRAKGRNPHVTRGTISCGDQRKLDMFLPQEGREFCASNGIRGICLWGYLKSDEGRRWYRHAMKGLIRAAKEQVPGRRVYEITGEPDLTAPNPEAVVEITRLAYGIITEDDPDGVICGPMLSAFSKMQYHRRLFELGLADWITAFGIHQYMPIPAEPTGILSKIRELRKMIRDRKGHDIPMFGGEGGFCISSTIHNDIVKMNGLVRAQLFMLGEGMGMSNIYYPADHGRKDGPPDVGDYGLMSNLDLGPWRYAPRRVSPRPVAPAIAAATRFTEGHRATGCLEGCFGKTSLGYSYATAEDECVIAVWDWGGEPSVAELNVGHGEIVVADIMGNERTVKTKDGVLTLTLGESPQYVLDPDPALWGKKGTEAARMQALAREREAAREAAREIALLSFSPTVLADGVLGVRGEVENRRDAPTDVVFETRIRGVPDARGKVQARLAPRETRCVDVPLPKFRPDAISAMKVEATATAKSGYTESLEAEENFLVAQRVPTGAGGDVFSNWTDPRYETVPGGDADCSLKVATAWNDKFVMFDAVVVDDDYSPTIPGCMSWNGDAIQLGIAKKVLLDSTENTVTDLYEEGLTETTFAFTKEGLQGYRTKSFDAKRLPFGSSPGDTKAIVDIGECPFEVKPENLPGGGASVRYRIAVPWAYLNLAAPPRPGDSVRCALWVCDRDSGDRMAIHGAKLFRLMPNPPKGYGRVILSP